MLLLVILEGCAILAELNTPLQEHDPFLEDIYELRFILSRVKDCIAFIALQFKHGCDIL